LTIFQKTEKPETENREFFQTETENRHWETGKTENRKPRFKTDFEQPYCKAANGWERPSRRWDGQRERPRGMDGQSGWGPKGKWGIGGALNVTMLRAKMGIIGPINVGNIIE
jgi:hypothetical protein